MRKIFGLIFSLVLAVSWAVYAFMDNPSVEKLEKTFHLSGRENVVVLGVDERPDEDDVGRSDTLFVLMMDPKSKDVSMLSIPRDTRVKIKGQGWDKINHAYAYGGVNLTRETVQNLLGIKINNYVTVNFQGFKDLVDAVGGIDIDVEKRMYYYDDWDGFKIDLQPGMQHMDGKQAIQYVRYRDEEGDIGRIERQQKFMAAVYKKMTSVSIVPRLPALLKQLHTMIKTDLSVSEMVDFARAMSTMMKEKQEQGGSSGLKAAMVPGTPEYIDDISYWLPDIPKLRQMMAAIQGGTMSSDYQADTQRLASEYRQSVNVEKPVPKTEAKKKQDARDGISKVAPKVTPPQKETSKNDSDSGKSSDTIIIEPPKPVKPPVGNTPKKDSGSTTSVPKSVKPAN